MKQSLKIALFSHSLVSDWNHGNAHFLRGLMRELVRLGHEVRCYEELGSWSLSHLMKYEGDRAIEAIDFASFCEVMDHHCRRARLSRQLGQLTRDRGAEPVVVRIASDEVRKGIKYHEP